MTDINQKIHQWEALKKQITELNNLEYDLRAEIAPHILDGKEEGSKTSVLGDYKLQATAVLNRTIDNAELIIRRDELTEDELAAIKYKPELKTSAYKKLPEDSILRRIVSTSPGKVQLKIVEHLGE